MNHEKLYNYIKKHSKENNLKDYTLTEEPNPNFPFNYILSITLHNSDTPSKWWLYDLDKLNHFISKKNRIEWNNTVFEQVMYYLLRKKEK